jgi:3-oxoacyl-[acyl-carrier protein] reductase
MSDFLVELGKQKQVRRLIKGLGLPIPMPQALARAEGPLVERPLADRDVGVWLSEAGPVAEALAQALAEAGANAHVAGNAGAVRVFDGPGEAFGRPAQPLVTSTESEEGAFKLSALVFDATAIGELSGLRALHEFFNPLLRRLRRCGRVVVLGRPPEEQSEPEAAAAQSALEGFVRSLGKELGRKGATANLVYVSDGTESRVAGPLRFLLTERSAYVSGQPLTLSRTARQPSDTPAWTYSLDGKVALVTGAARGIGAATARLLADEGARVVCLDRPADDGPTSKLARDIDGAVLLTDVTDPEAPGRIAHYLQSEHGGVDVVVHNAGVTRDKTLAKMTPQLWEQAIDVNLAAVVRITEGLLEEALNSYGRIICLSSIAGLAGNVGQTNYAASKSGLVGFVRTLSAKLGRRGVTVNAVAPGFIETRLTQAMPFALREAARRMNSLSQSGRPSDVGEVITFLATPHSQGLTGQVIRVCGQALVGA